jgi:hypothetical protein
MTQIFNIVDDTVIVNKIALKYTTGQIIHSGSLQVAGVTQLNGGLNVIGTLAADTINVKNLVTENGGLASIGEWVYDTETELNGKGFTWEWADNQTKLIFRNGNRLWTNANFDLSPEAVYSIGDTTVLTADSLGDTVTNSKLTSLGTLNSLEVSGDTVLGEFVFVNSTYNRIGVGTDEPNSALSIVDNNVEIVVGAPNNVATIGAYTNHDVNLVTDNVPRLTAKANGEIHIGNEFSKTGVLRVFGTLYADAVQTDNRITRTHPLEFKATADTTVYGLGLTWTGTGVTKQLTLMSGQEGDRIWSTENIELAASKAFRIDGTDVLSQTALGETVTASSLTSVGTLETLTVANDAVFHGAVDVKSITAEEITFGNVTLNQDGFSTNDTITISANQAQVIYSDASQISIGDRIRNDKQVKVFGSLSVGINNPQPDVNFAVNGDVRIGGKKFTNGMAAPTSGTFEVGDICWNTRPQATSYVGWVCVVAGDPGEWLPFGGINVQ